jgi:hypothetical protein
MNKEQSIKLLDEQLSTAYNADVLKKFIYAAANGIDRNVIQILFKNNYYNKNNSVNFDNSIIEINILINV